MPLIRSPLWSDPSVQPPPGAVDINREHPLARGLVFAVVGGHYPEYTTRQVVDVRANSSQVENDMIGRAWSCRTVSAASAGFAWPLTPGMLSIQRAFTVAYALLPRAFENVNAGADSGGVFVVSYRAAGWQNPWVSLNLGRAYNTNAKGELDYAVNATTVASVFTTSDAYFITRERFHQYVATRDQANAVFYRDGLLFETATFSTNADVDWGERRPVELLAKNNGASNATDASVAYAYVWNRALSAAEVFWLSAEPYAFFRPIVRRRWFVPAAGTPVSAAVAPSWEAAGGVAVSGVAAWEALAGVRTSSTTAYEGLASATRATGSPWEALAGLRPSTAVPWEAGGVAQTPVSSAVAAPWEGLSATSGTAPMAWEALVRVSVPTSAPWEALITVTPARSAGWEALAGTSAAPTTSWEAVRTVSAAVGVSWEATGAPVTRAIAVPWEAGGGAAPVIRSRRLMVGVGR